MQSFIEVGMISFRTKCLTIERAGSFARALNANSSRFTDVEIRESKKARGEARWYVSYQPVSPVRQAAMLDREQTTQEQRAAEREYTIVQDPDFDYLHVFSFHSGDTHEVSIQGATCSCPHFEHRLRGTGILCTHLIAAAKAIRRGEVGEFRVIPAPAPDRKFDEQRFNEIFA